MKPYEPPTITDLERFYAELGIPMPQKLKRVTVDPYSGHVAIRPRKPGCIEEMVHIVVCAPEFFALPESER